MSNKYSVYFTGTNTFTDHLPITNNDKVKWYFDPEYQHPIVLGTTDWTNYATLENATNYIYGGINLYGRIEPKKFLDAEGVKVLFDLLSLQDYPNNDVLMAVINAIDATKFDKNKIFVGTSNEYQIANTKGEIQEGAIVVLTDVD